MRTMSLSSQDLFLGILLEHALLQALSGEEFQISLASKLSSASCVLQQASVTIY